ncbi:hypothetical protein ACFV1N_39485 [Streptosporangium canum]
MTTKQATAQSGRPHQCWAAEAAISPQAAVWIGVGLMASFSELLLQAFS